MGTGPVLCVNDKTRVIGCNVLSWFSLFVCSVLEGCAFGSWLCSVSRFTGLRRQGVCLTVPADLGASSSHSSCVGSGSCNAPHPRPVYVPSSVSSLSPEG